MRDALRDGLSTIAEFVPKLALFLVILIVGIIVAKVIAKALNALLERAGFDRAVERGGIKKALSGSKMDASDIVAKLIYYTLLLFVLQLAFGVFGDQPDQPPHRGRHPVPAEPGRGDHHPGRRGLHRRRGQGPAAEHARRTVLRPHVANIASTFILFLGVIAALNQVGVATTVTTPVLIAILATVGGVIVVGVGGGLIRPMQQRWEGYLSTAEREAPRMKAQAESAPSVREQAQSAAQGVIVLEQHLRSHRPEHRGLRPEHAGADRPPRACAEPPRQSEQPSHKENTHMDTNDHGRLIGQTLYSSDNEKIGKIGQVFLDDETGRPEFLTVNTGLFGMSESFVPAADATSPVTAYASPSPRTRSRTRPTSTSTAATSTSPRSGASTSTTA